MKPNFALSLSFEGLRLMHRVEGGWHLIGEVALDDPDMTQALAGLRAAAEVVDPGNVYTKLLIPNDQIKYLALDGTRSTEDDVRDALHGATPYAIDDLVYDFAKGGGRTYIAAVAKETLEEARQFADEHGFNPVSYAAVPEPFTYMGEAFLGSVAGQEVERDAEAVVVIGRADVEVPRPEPVAVDDAIEAPEPEEPLQLDDAVKVEPEEATDSIEYQADEATAFASVRATEPEPETTAPTEPQVEPEREPELEAELVPEQSQTIDSDIAPEAEAPIEPEPVSEPDPETDPEPEAHAAQTPAVEPDTETEIVAAPTFTSLRADRNDGRPAPQIAESDTPERAEPTFGRHSPPSLAVPTGQGTDPMPPLFAPDRQADAPAVAAPPPISADTPAPDAAPAITGEAATALPPEATVAAASLIVEAEADPEDEPSTTSGAHGNDAVAGGGGGMFASRRMARAKAREGSDAAKADKPQSKTTVFGARKQPKPKPVVGGKPRFLGLILTAILLLFLLAIAAFAALSEEGIAHWFGFGRDTTQVASAPADTTDIPALEVAAATAAPEAEPQEPTDAVDATPLPVMPTGGQILTPEEAQRIYAATGVWQRSPRFPLTPRTSTLDDMQMATASQAMTRWAASPLQDVSFIAGDAVIAAPIDPPPPSATFNFDNRGLVVATPDGTVTPDGILVIAGAPPLNPPTRPGTVAPEVTPQDQLAEVVPEEATPLTDVPDGVIVIAGRPAITPPIRPGTAAPAAAPEAAALASGDTPLLESDGLLVLAGSPPVLPPIRPGTTAPAATPEPVEPLAEAPESAPSLEAPEGVNLIAGSPPLLPPARPGTVAPQTEAAAERLTQEVAAALTSGTAQTPDTNTPRPQPRPTAIVEAAVARANTPILGALTAVEAAAFRPRTRPNGLAPEPEPEPEPAPEVETATTGLQISPEIAAAVEAAANRPNPIVNPTQQAVAASLRPDTRPRNMQRIVDRAVAAQQRAAQQVASVAPRTVAPSGPTAGSVATNATLENAINLREINLIGIYGGSNDRRALVRLSNGRYQRLTVGDRLDGGRVTAISAAALSYTKRGRSITLEVPG